MTHAHRLCVAPMMDWTDLTECGRGLVHRGTPRLDPATPRFIAIAIRMRNQILPGVERFGLDFGRSENPASE